MACGLDRNFCIKLSRNEESRRTAHVSDIVNGSAYKEISRMGYSQSQWNLTLTLNTDVVSIFNTSRTGSLWPVYLTVNELPPKLRFVLCSCLYVYNVLILIDIS